MVVVRTGGEGGRREGSRQRGEEKREEEEREERGGSRGEDEGEERGGERQEGTKPREASGRRSSQCAVRGCLSLDGGDAARPAPFSSAGASAGPAPAMHLPVEPAGQEQGQTSLTGRSAQTHVLLAYSCSRGSPQGLRL